MGWLQKTNLSRCLSNTYRSGRTVNRILRLCKRIARTLSSAQRREVSTSAVRLPVLRLLRTGYLFERVSDALSDIETVRELSEHQIAATGRSLKVRKSLVKGLVLQCQMSSKTREMLEGRGEELSIESLAGVLDSCGEIAQNCRLDSEDKQNANPPQEWTFYYGALFILLKVKGGGPARRRHQSGGKG